MILIEKSMIKVDPTKVQTDLNLEEILLKNTRYSDTLPSAEDPLEPLLFSVSVRSTYSNEVLEFTENNKSVYYTTLEDVPPVIHKGYDLVMYLGSICLTRHVAFKSAEDQQDFFRLMSKKSGFTVMGLYVSNVLPPIVYSQIVLTDDGMQEIKKYLKANVKPVKIEDMKREGNIEALLNKIIIVKKEDKP